MGKLNKPICLDSSWPLWAQISFFWLWSRTLWNGSHKIYIQTRYRSGNFSMATFYTESQRENWSNIFRFLWLTFRKKSSSFYGMPWGRRILVSMSSLRERTELRNRKAGEGPRKNFCYWGCFRGLHFWAPTTEKNVRLKPWHINNYTNAKGFKNQLRDKVAME